MRFGLFETDATVAFLAKTFGLGTEIMNYGFDGVKCISMVRTYVQRLDHQVIDMGGGGAAR
jgi:hypothetical protein